MTIVRNVWWHKTFSKVGQIPQKSNWLWTKTIVHLVLKFQFNHACFQGEASADFGEKVE